MAKEIKDKKTSAHNNAPSHTQTQTGAVQIDRVFWSRAAILWLLGGFWFFAAINPTDTNYFSNYDAVAIGVLLSIVQTAQTIALTISAFIGVLQRHLNLLFAAFAATNFYYLLLAVNESFNALPIILQLVLLLLATWVIWILFAAAKNNRHWRLGILSVGGVLFAQAALTQAIYQYSVSNKLGGAPAAVAIGETTSSPNVRAVKFTRHPNIYLLSFDGLVPEVIAKQYLKRDKLDYQSVLKKHGFRRFKNHFSDGPESRESLNKILALDYNYYYGLSSGQSKFSPFSEEYTLYAGLSPAPVWEIFKANDYITYAFSYDHYMGAAKGAHLDNYFIPGGFSACATRAGNEVRRMFFHYCPILFNAYYNNWFNLQSSRLLNISGEHRNTDIDRLLLAIETIADNKKPGILLAYIAIPGHAGPPYNYRIPNTHAAFYAQFAEGDKKTAVAIDRIMQEIKRKDPQAIVYIFGDHGATFTRPVDTRAMLNAPQPKRWLHVVDHFGIYGGIYPADACSESFADRFSPRTITMSEVMRHIIRCLADGEDPAITPINYPVYLHLTWHQSVKWSDSFNDYLYE